MMPEMEMVKDAALKYDKPTLARMAQMGQLSPTIAVMAGMMRDRIVQSEMKPPEQTVAEEVMQPMGQRMGLGAIAPGAEMQGQPQQPPQGGLSQIPVPEQMFDRPEMANGGIVAFQAGGGTFSSFMGEGMREDRPTMRGIVPTFTGALEGIGDYFRGGIYKDIEKLKQLGYTDAQISTMSPEQRSEVARMSRESIREAEKQSPTESLIAQAQRGEGPNVSKPAAPADMAQVPSGGPAIPRPTDLQMGQQPPPPGPKPEPEPTSEVPGLREQLMGRMKEAFPDQAGGAKPTEPSVKGLFQERAEAERIAGVDKRFFENEAKRIVALSDKLKGDKNEAANMRLIEAGLRIMGGESPYAFVNIGKGASEALKGFADDVKDIQKTKREYDKAERDLRIAEQTYARSKSDEALKTLERRRELAQNRNTSFQKAMMDMEMGLAKLGVQESQVRAQERAAAKPSQFQEMYEAERADPERFKRFRESFASKDDALQRQKLADEALAKSIDYVRLSGSKKPEDIRRANEMKQGIYARYGVGAGAGGADPLGLFR
jgi:hypothetical protein